jgi:MerR family mercuric resistance operon transcriptional regulator
MFIGELARQVGLNIESVRFYEREGLLPSPPRSASGYRCYERRHLETLRFIKRSQALGFSLREIRQLLDIYERVATPGKHSSSQNQKLLQLTRERLASIDEKISTLQSMRGALSKFLRIYQRQKKLVCPAGR